MKNMTRLIACVLVLATLIACLPVTAMAYTDCTVSGQYKRTIKVHHQLGYVNKIERGSTGTAKDIQGTTYNPRGTYSIVVKDSKGKVVFDDDWNADSKASVTIIGRLKATGTYTVTITAVRITASKYSVLKEYCKWTAYPTYKLTWYLV